MLGGDLAIITKADLAGAAEFNREALEIPGQAQL